MPTPRAAPTVAQRLSALEARVQQLEAVAQVRACVNRYMAWCDALDADTPLPALLDCFTEDALWAGLGERHGRSFGTHQGRAGIGRMFQRYMGQPPHFAFNAHFLCSEQIDVLGTDRAQAQWLMLQTSTFHAGGSHLNAARLRLALTRCTDGQWRIARFETENLLSRPVSTWHSDAPLPVPDERA